MLPNDDHPLKSEALKSKSLESNAFEWEAFEWDDHFDADEPETLPGPGDLLAFDPEFDSLGDSWLDDEFDDLWAEDFGDAA